MRREIKKVIDNKITNQSSVDSDGAILQELSCALEYQQDEFLYVKTRLGSKYGLKLHNYHNRSKTIEEWRKIKDAFLIIKESSLKKSTEPKAIKDNDRNKNPDSDLSEVEALARFYRLKAEEKRQKLLKQVQNVGCLLS
jgi:hypothetical protein